MSKQIRITESQLAVLRKSINEQWGDTGSGMEKNVGMGDEMDSMKKSVSNYMNQDEVSFNSPEELLSSITDRLANALTQKEWMLVQEVFNDVRTFQQKNKSQEDLPSIGDKSSVESDTPEEYQERNYGVNESVEKIRLDFKRFL